MRSLLGAANRTSNCPPPCLIPAWQGVQQPKNCALLPLLALVLNLEAWQISKKFCRLCMKYKSDISATGFGTHAEALVSWSGMDRVCHNYLVGIMAIM
jgi:hypothetical protein